MSFLLLNYSLFHLITHYDAFHSPLLSFNANQKVALFSSHFSHFTSPILFCSQYFNVYSVFFSNVLNTPIKVRSSHSSYENKMFTSPITIDSASKKISSIKKCCFNKTSSRNGNGAINFDAHLTSVLIDDCTFYKCTSTEKNGVFDIEFLDDFDSNDNSAYSINVTNCCFFNCSTNQESQASSLFSISTSFQSVAYSSLLFNQNLVYENGHLDINDYVSKAYLVTSKSLKSTHKIEARYNNFTHNEGNLYFIKSPSALNPLISETTIVNNTCRSSSLYFSFLGSTSPEIRNTNIVSNNFTRSSIFSTESSVKIDNVYFLNNIFLNIVIKYEEHYFGFKNCVFDFSPQINLDDSNIILEEGKYTDTIKIDNKDNNSCYVYVSPNKKVSKSSWITVGIFMFLGIAANIVIVVALVLYLRRRKGQKFLAIAEVPSGYDQVYDADI